MILVIVLIKTFDKYNQKQTGIKQISLIPAKNRDA